MKKNGSTILILGDQHVAKIAECLPRICESMSGNELYGCKEGDFKLNTMGSYRIARLYLDKQYIGLRIGDLQYLSRIFHVLQNQLKVYTLPLPDVLAFVTVALTSDNYVEPAPNASEHIVYSQHFDELKTTLLKKQLFHKYLLLLNGFTCLHVHSK